MLKSTTPKPFRALNRSILVFCMVIIACCSTDSEPTKPFVEVEGGRLSLQGQDYRFVGVNLWYAAYIGAADKPFGDQDRLREELDLLRQSGITNLRILGGSEESSIDVALTPSIQGPDGLLDEELLRGLDFALAEMGKRDMKAVIYLTNFWEWSGGMAAYLSWHNGGRVVDAADPGTTWWPDFAILTKEFYANPSAVSQYHEAIEKLVLRENTVTGLRYRDDPTIMAWQLANEPRPGVSMRPGEADLEGFYDWIESSAALIQSLDPNHLVSIGSEGITGCLETTECVMRAHASEHVDYITAHIWPLNWGWLDRDDMTGSLPTVLANTRQYISAHENIAQTLGKPLVLEEFGLPRDGGALERGTSTVLRDEFLRETLARVEDPTSAVVGTNIWAWGGQGRAEHSDYIWREDDTSYTGDPPQEPQGLNSIFADDVSTLDVIREHARKIGAIADSSSSP